MRIAAYVLPFFAGTTMVAGTGLVCSQDYPTKPIRIITSPAGGGSDFSSRLVAQGLAPLIAQPVIVDNKGSTIISLEAASKALPDGYTLTVQGGVVWIYPLLQKAPYDAVRDFAPITLLSLEPSVLAVHPSVPAKSVKDLIDLARAKPGVLNYASAAAGGVPHLSAELFKSMAGVNIVWVPYKGSGIALTAILGNEVQMLISDVGFLMPHVKAGKLRALAVTTAQATPLAPGLPTVAASGLPGYESVGRTGIWAPAKTPTAIIQRLNREIVRAFNQPDTKDKVLGAGAEVVGNTPEQFAALITADIIKWSKVIKDAGIRVE
jgi:tripartite-type tricarboxylate transporter receptor subunit TctC